MVRPTALTVLKDILSVLRRSEPALGVPINIAQMQISTATALKPLDADVIANAAAGQTGYDIIAVYNSVKRLSNAVFLINDGPGILYFLMTPDGRNWSGEAEILKNEFKCITGCWEIRVRSPDASTKFRTSEFLPGSVI